MRKPTAGELAELGSGRWRAVDPEDLRANLDAAQLRELEELEALGYADGTQPRRATGVTIYDPSKAQPGFNLYSSGHAPEAILMDMEGRELHRWSHSFQEIWPDRQLNPKKLSEMWWRRVHLMENGDLIAIFEGLGIIKLNSRSQLLWANPIAAHHDIAVLPSGDILTLTRRSRTRRSSETSIIEDLVTRLGADGAEKESVSVLKALQRSRFRDLLGKRPKRTGDILHTNSLEVLDGRLAHHGAAFAPGLLLISIRMLDAIMTMDLTQGRIVWARQGAFKRQHDPRALENGNILLFDNQGKKNRSRVQEIDPVSGDVVWEYRGNAQSPLYTEFLGAARRLANGNTLITESEAGRALEVTPQGEIVWEFYTPHHAGSRQEFIASLSEVVRLPLDFPVDWLEDRGVPSN